jgi:lipopolysaccharide export system permease protein
VGLGYGLHMALLPASTTAFKDLQYKLRNEQADLLLEEGTFNQLGDNLMVYLKRRVTPTQVQMLLVHDTRVADHPVTWMAQSGDLVVGPDGQPRLVLHHGIRQEVDPHKVNVLEFEEHAIDLKSQLSQATFGPRASEVEEYSLRDLFAGRDATTAKRKHEMLAEAHRRLLWPLAPIPLVLWAGACLLQVPGRRSSMLRNLSLASGGAIAFVALLMGAKGAAEGGSAAILYGQWLLPVALSAYSIWKLRTASYG